MIALCVIIGVLNANTVYFCVVCSIRRFYPTTMYLGDVMFNVLASDRSLSTYHWGVIVNTQNQDTNSKWKVMSTSGLVPVCKQYKYPTRRVGLVQSGHQHHYIKNNVLLLLHVYSWKIGTTKHSLDTLCFSCIHPIDGLNLIVLASSEVDRGFEPRSCETKEH